MRQLYWLVACVVVLWSAESTAQSGESGVDGSNDAALAEATFEQGRQAIRQGEIERGCALLEASDTLEPALGTSLTLAHCYELLGRTASSWALFIEAEAWAKRVGDGERAQIARVRAEALATRLTRARFVLPKGKGRPSELTLDGVLIEPAAWAVDFPIDPGTHRIQAAAPGFEPWTKELELVASTEVVRVVIPELRAIEQAQPVPARVPPPPRPTVARDESWVWVAGGASVLALGGSGVLTVLAQQDYDESLKHCRTERACDERGVQLRGDAFTKAGWATGAAAAGVVLGGVTAYLWLDADEGSGPLESVTVNLSPSDAQLRLQGAF